MPFPTSTGVLLPDDFKTIHHVYSKIADESWFTQCPERREHFALTVMDTYRRGITEEAELSAHCRDIAVQRFGNATAQ